MISHNSTMPTASQPSNVQPNASKASLNGLNSDSMGQEMARSRCKKQCRDCRRSNTRVNSLLRRWYLVSLKTPQCTHHVANESSMLPNATSPFPRDDSPDTLRASSPYRNQRGTSLDPYTPAHSTSLSSTTHHYEDETPLPASASSRNLQDTEVSEAGAQFIKEPVQRRCEYTKHRIDARHKRLTWV